MIEFGIYYLVFFVIFYLTFESRKDIGKNLIEININFLKYIFFLYPRKNQKKQSKKKRKPEDEIGFFDGYLIPVRFALWLFILGKIYLLLNQ